MKDYNFNSKNSAKHEIEAIKDDLKDIMKRMRNLKGEGMDLLCRESSNLMSIMSEMKDNIHSHGKANFDKAYHYAEDNPLKTTFAGLLLGVMLVNFLLR